MLNRNKILRGTYRKHLDGNMHPELVAFAYNLMKIPIPLLVGSENGIAYKVPKMPRPFTQPAGKSGYLGWDPSKSEN